MNFQKLSHFSNCFIFSLLRLLIKYNFVLSTDVTNFPNPPLGIVQQKEWFLLRPVSSTCRCRPWMIIFFLVVFFTFGRNYKEHQSYLYVKEEIFFNIMEILWLFPHILNLKKTNRLMICIIFSKLKTLYFLVLWSQLTLDWIFKDCGKKN